MTSLMDRIGGLRADTKTLIDRIRAVSQTCDLPPLPEAVEGIVEKLDQHQYSVPVIGEVKHGKSSFLNAVVGKSLLPVGEKVATNQIFRIGKAGAFACRLRFEDGSEEPITEKDLETFGSEVYANSPRARAAARGKLLRWIEIDVPAEAAKFLPDNIVLFDTPGLGSIHVAHGRITRRLLPYADGVIFVLTSERPITEDEIAWLQEIFDITRNVFFIQTGIDKGTKLYKETLSRNREILVQRFGENLPEPQIWPVSSTNLMKATETSDMSYLQVSRFDALSEALQIFLFRSAGVEKLDEATTMIAAQLHQGREILDTRLRSLLNETRQEQATIQRQIEDKRRAFDQNWGIQGEERTRLLADLRQTLQRGRRQFEQALYPSGSVARVIGREIDQIDSVKAARIFAESLNTNILEWAEIEWRKAGRDTQTACTARLAPLLADISDFAAGLEEPGGASISRTATVSARGDLWTRIVGGRVASIQAVMTTGVGATLLGTIITAAWFPPLSLSAVAATAVWSFFRSFRETGERELKNAREELRRHLMEALNEVRDHFLHVSAGEPSPVDRCFGGLETHVFKQVDDLIQSKSSQMKEEVERLEADARLDKAARETRLASLRDQIREWGGLIESGDALIAAITGLIEDLTPRKAAL
ncbi:dynamin family protein [Tistrella mobilis]|uniref:dynamin family protein n=2 Tax=Tistrella mobilis TaxID=171437 RepID=UPI0031F65922